MTDENNNKRINRRQFVEKSTLLAGGAVLASTLADCATSGSPAASAAYVGGSGTLKLAVIELKSVPAPCNEFTVASV